MGLKVIILAAGKGKRMASSISKTLHKLGGIPLLQRVVNTAESLDPDNIFVVYGNGGTYVREQLNHLPVTWISQEEQLGTGHAVLQAMPECKDSDKILVLYGDVPLITTKTLKQLLKDTPRNGLGLIVTELDDPSGFGRIIRNEMGNIVAIVEDKDATRAQLKITEINTGIITTTAKFLKEWLPDLRNNNKQKEYYLTDIVALAVNSGHPVGGIMAHCREEVRGVNDRWQLAKLERYYQYTKAKELAYLGVTIADPDRIDMRGDIETGVDVFFDINIVCEGIVKIGDNCTIGPNVYLKDTIIGNNVEILANSVIEGAVIKESAKIGPFARLRPGTIIEKFAHVGNFVEIKNTTVGEGSKANHLTYLGDTSIGKYANIGAGTITCNYDGMNKWPTTIGDGAFIGSNTSLVAPINIGAHATIAAGSTISQDAPAEKLTISRPKQTVIEKWKSPRQRKAEHKTETT